MQSSIHICSFCMVISSCCMVISTSLTSFICTPYYLVSGYTTLGKVALSALHNLIAAVYQQQNTLKRSTSRILVYLMSIKMEIHSERLCSYDLFLAKQCKSTENYARIWQFFFFLVIVCMIFQKIFVCSVLCNPRLTI